MIMTVTLRVYVDRDCWNCQEARALAQEMAAMFPSLRVELIDLEQAGSRPDTIFATPTFVLNDRVISLGNPSRAALCQHILQALQC
ncbi:MAG: hypothetical protein C4309_12650 [Chloroflexota bacterium]